LSLEGGTGRATLETPAKAVKTADGYMLTVAWSSPFYDYMLVDGIKYLPINSDGNSVFEIPVKTLTGEITVIADTVAMSTPHEIEYTIVFKNEPIKLSNLELKYAKCFSVDFYENDYVHIAVNDGTDYVLVPEGQKEYDLGLKKPVYIPANPDKIYLAASSAMDLFAQLGGLDKISFVSTKAEDYSITEAAGAIKKGSMKYVGKYSAPDYETLVKDGCNLAIESTMINHSPKIKEELTRLSIPVFVEKSSYEAHPLGRLEWIKLYGILYGAEDKANQFFNEAAEHASKIMGSSTDKSVAFFYITAGGMVNARLSTDYIAKMIEMSGGTYCLNSDKKADISLNTISLHKEKATISVPRKIVKCKKTGDIMLAPFSGAVSECVAAKLTGRHYIGFETDSEYCKISKERLNHTEEEHEQMNTFQIKQENSKNNETGD